MDADRRLVELAAVQHGQITHWDARAAGLSAEAVRCRVHRGDWIAIGPRVLGRTGVPYIKATPLIRAVLDAGPGAFLSHATAAAWWGLPGFDLLRIHVTRARSLNGTRPRLAHRLHEVLDLSTDQVTVLDGVPVVRPERLCFELFATAHPRRAARATETAWSKGLLSGGSLRLIFDQLAGRGRGGTVAMRTFLKTHPNDWVPPASNLEARFQAVMDEQRLGQWRRQVDLGDQRWCGRVDFLAVDRPLVVEVQSERYHTALLDIAHDAERRAKLHAAGFTVVEVWDHEVWHDKATVLAKVRGPWFELAPYRRSA
jgi:very-short-patch-repair endonuclease